MALTAQQVEAMVNANAAALDLRIAAEHRPGVIAFATIAAGMAELVNGLPLGIDDEPAAVFTPVSPEAGA